ncbi:hypothetical protein Bca4012_065586 [Brassica carinata]|uniref:Uncharacterized protein n=1 Tax=Brassica carinata TaxID=52824 RepID=A0A8X7VMX3_BRACI|nr:hypothetical protein Bca52824_017900 [Brassica carinata]
MGELGVTEEELYLRRIRKVVEVSIKLLQPPPSSCFSKNKSQNLNQKREGEREREHSRWEMR